ncbi:hypothetical protein V1503_02925 [Bacillus sp. SCS-151]|uniref:hypothetical protein n=1 Tax=Nanhaiella sioensis TaxID=3115293 RepID=UPI00397C69F1
MNILNSVITAAIVFTGGAGLSLISEIDTLDENSVNRKQDVSYDQMTDWMVTGNFESMQQFMEEGIVKFEQMEPYMNDMHPNLDYQEQEELYKRMHGGGGSSQSSNLRGMSMY